MNPLSDLERLVVAIEKQGANVAPTYQEYMPLAFACLLYTSDAADD